MRLSLQRGHIHFKVHFLLVEFILVISTLVILLRVLRIGPLRDGNGATAILTGGIAARITRKLNDAFGVPTVKERTVQ